MVDVVAVTGSRSRTSRSQALADALLGYIESSGLRVARLCVRDLPAVALVAGNLADPAIAEALELVRDARALVVSTPIYKASYTGLLKLLIDLLPVDALVGKVVLPIAAGAAEVHALALEHTLKPVLASLAPRLVLPGLFVLDRETEAGQRLAQAAGELIHSLPARRT